jgi:hypothetical protein
MRKLSGVRSRFASEALQLFSLSVFASIAACWMRGFIAGPNIFGFSLPLTVSIESRMASASRRRNGIRQSSRFSGSLAAYSGFDCLLMRHVLLVRIRRCSFFSDHPASCVNQCASQSSSSGCVGGSPIRPKSLGVRTRPWPKCCCQTRLTITRAVSGFAGLAIHCASPSLRREVRSSGGGNSGCRRDSTAGTAGETSAPRCVGEPRSSTWVSGGFAEGSRSV